MLRISATSDNRRNRGSAISSVWHLAAIAMTSSTLRRELPAAGGVVDNDRRQLRLSGTMCARLDSQGSDVPTEPERRHRLVMPRWLDVRLVAGVALVLLAVVAGARVFAAAGRYTEVYVARQPLAPGEHLRADDLGIGRIRFGGGGGSYIAATGSPPVGYLVTRYVGLGELVPLAALSGSGAAPAQSRLVTVPVAPGHLPDDLAHGDLIDLYLTPKVSDTDNVPPPTTVLTSVAVDSDDAGSQSLSGGSMVSLVLAVPLDRVASVVHAVESGTLDVVRVPAAAVGSAPSSPPLPASPVPSSAASSSAAATR
jgi:hypothetical protein